GYYHGTDPHDGAAYARVRHHSRVFVRGWQPDESRTRHEGDAAFYPQDQADQSRLRDHRAALHAHAATRLDVRRRGWKDLIPRHARRMGFKTVDGFHAW